MTLSILFLILIGILFYTYFGYGMVAFVFGTLKKKFPPLFSDIESLPTVTVLIAAYNEQDCIVEKLENTQSLNYPVDKLNIWVVTDGSTDLTPKMVAAFPNVKLFHQPERNGKLHAVDRVMEKVTTDVTVFTDANTLLTEQSLMHLIQPFADKKVGVVAGEKRVVSPEKSAVATEGFYWKYESFLKKMGSWLHSTPGAAGELFAIRTALYEPVPADTYIEDFVLSLQIAAKGYRIDYAENAIASELPSASVRDEEKRKVRIAAGGLQASWRLRKLYNPFRYGWLSFQLFSHRTMRWTLAPLSLPLLLLVNSALCFQPESGLYLGFLLAQLTCYALAALGYATRNRQAQNKLLFVPYYFLMMNLCVFKGMKRLMKGSQSVVWEKASRQTLKTATASVVKEGELLMAVL